MIDRESGSDVSADATTLSFSHCASLPSLRVIGDEQGADPQRRGMAAINLRRKRAPAYTSAACAAQYFVESISQPMLGRIPAYLRNHGKPQPKF
jgi:hypothetical protein